MRDLDWKEVRSKKCVDPVAQTVPKEEGLVGIHLLDHPLERHGAVENVPHSSSPSRKARMAGTPMSRRPSLLKISSRSRSMSSQARRMASGSRMPLAARSTAQLKLGQQLGRYPAIVVCFHTIHFPHLFRLVKRRSPTTASPYVLWDLWVLWDQWKPVIVSPARLSPRRPARPAIAAGRRRASTSGRRRAPGGRPGSGRRAIRCAAAPTRSSAGRP